MDLTLTKRFWAKVERLSIYGCWLWTGALNEHGYGMVRAFGKATRAHRASLSLAGYDVPDDMDVLHRCHNPACVNPGHLYIGTAKQNTADARDAGRISEGERHPISKLKAVQVQEIRALKGQLSQRALARRYGVSRGAIDAIHRGNNWKGLPAWH